MEELKRCVGEDGSALRVCPTWRGRCAGGGVSLVCLRGRGFWEMADGRGWGVKVSGGEDKEEGDGRKGEGRIEGGEEGDVRVPINIAI